MGILLYDEEGELVDANPAAIKLIGLPKLKDLPEINLFHNPIIPCQRDEIREKGVIRFQTQLDSGKIRDYFIFTSCDPLLIEGTVSTIDSGYLVQIQEVISERTEELHISEERYRRFFEDDLTGDFIATPEGAVMECNPAFAEIYGFSSRENALEANIADFNPDDWENLIKNLETDHKIQGHQTTHQRPDGRNIHIVSNVVAMFDESGQLIQVKGYVFDDTERKEAEEALKRSEEKYRRLFNEDLTGDFIATLDGEILECNPAFAQIHGFKDSEEAVGSNISKFNTHDWENLITRLQDKGKIQDYQSWQIRPDNMKIHVVANVVGISNDQGEMVQVKGYVFDDTERKEAEEALKQSEEKYHRLFDEDLTGDFIATLDGKILECNPAFAEIYGFDTIENALKWNISESNPFDWPYMVTRLKSEGKIMGFQSWQRRYDIMRIHVIANLVGIFNDSDELVQVKGYVFDDTERKQAEEKLESGKQQVTNILDSIQDGFMALNNFWNFIYVNRCAAEYLGVDADDLLGQNLWERFPEFTGTVYETRLRKAMGDKEIQHFEISEFSKNDHWFDISVYPSDDGISVYWRDITECKSGSR
ncbi:PAS/PAC sensor protein [Methanobacterium formicicum DSM 3637]|uniref:histidine kinase n=2 Tax=Methanobacterium formicicum TaxID=2162 RepID=K2RTR2_METFP|nr:PAS/PAC sensor protein [Methanobacterium formicicum DSM 3637]